MLCGVRWEVPRSDGVKSVRARSQIALTVGGTGCTTQSKLWTGRQCSGIKCKNSNRKRPNQEQEPVKRRFRGHYQEWLNAVL